MRRHDHPPHDDARQRAGVGGVIGFEGFEGDDDAAIEVKKPAGPVAKTSGACGSSMNAGGGRVSSAMFQMSPRPYGDGRLWRSLDGGSNWTLVGPGACDARHSGGKGQ